MGAKSSIEWTDATWNPIPRLQHGPRGSETGGCLNCYAAREAIRHIEHKDPADNHPLVKIAGPFHGFARMTSSGPRWTGKVELVERHLEDPLRWRKPKRIFVNSMSDLFHESLSDGEIDRVFRVMLAARRHTFQVLTKRPERMLSYLQRFRPDGQGWITPQGHDAITTAKLSISVAHWPLPNVWLGVSVENQATADARIPLLLKTPAAVRFVSYEPALGPVDFTQIKCPGAGYENALTGEDADGPGMCSCGLDWVIVGGESGPGARPFDLAWAEQTIKQCGAAGVPCFVKQLGSNPRECGFRYCCEADPRMGGYPLDWPRALRVRQFPEVRV